jgi:hypothetical protein
MIADDIMKIASALSDAKPRRNAEMAWQLCLLAQKVRSMETLVERRRVNHAHWQREYRARLGAA